MLPIVPSAVCRGCRAITMQVCRCRYGATTSGEKITHNTEVMQDAAHASLQPRCLYHALSFFIMCGGRAKGREGGGGDGANLRYTMCFKIFKSALVMLLISWKHFHGYLSCFGPCMLFGGWTSFLLYFIIFEIYLAFHALYFDYSWAKQKMAPFFSNTDGKGRGAGTASRTEPKSIPHPPAGAHPTV